VIIPEINHLSVGGAIWVQGEHLPGPTSRNFRRENSKLVREKLRTRRNENFDQNARKSSKEMVPGDGVQQLI